MRIQHVSFAVATFALAVGLAGCTNAAPQTQPTPEPASSEATSSAPAATPSAQTEELLSAAKGLQQSEPDTPVIVALDDQQGSLSAEADLPDDTKFVTIYVNCVGGGTIQLELPSIGASTTYDCGNSLFYSAPVDDPTAGLRVVVNAEPQQSWSLAAVPSVEEREG